MDLVSNSFEKMKNDFVKRKSEEEEEENLNFEIQTDNLTARFKLEKQLHCSEKEKKNDIHTMETDPVKAARFNLGRNLNYCSEEKKSDIDTRKSEDLNCLEKKSGVMEKSHSDEEKEEEEEEERMKWRIEDDEYVCYVCGLRGNKFLDHSFFGCNQQEVAHRYCALKEIKDESLEAKDESLEWGKGLEDCASLEGGKGMSPLLSEFFQKLAETETSVIDHFILKKQKQK